MPLVQGSGFPVFIFYQKDDGKKYPEGLAARYDVTKEIGRGAMGTVFRGFRKADGGCVAVKEVPSLHPRC